MAASGERKGVDFREPVMPVDGTEVWDDNFNCTASSASGEMARVGDRMPDDKILSTGEMGCLLTRK